MANTIKVEVLGLAEVEAKLYDLPSKVAKKYMRKALRAAGAIWLKEFERTAARDTGFMASQAAMTTRLSARQDEGAVNVGFRTRQNPARVGKHVPSAANEARWVELGTIKQPPRPFMRPAFEAFWGTALDRFADVLKEMFQ